MPCIRNCPFHEICQFYGAIYNDSKLSYAGICTVEHGLFTTLHEKFVNNPAYFDVSKSLLDEYVYLFIKIERLLKEISLNPELTVEGNRLSKSYEVLARLQKKFIKVTEEIMTAIKSSC